MEDETLSSPEVVRLTQAHFIDVKVDSELEADLFERLIGERGALATCVVDPSEDVIAILPWVRYRQPLRRFSAGHRKGYPRLVLLRTKRDDTQPIRSPCFGSARRTKRSAVPAGRMKRTARSSRSHRADPEQLSVRHASALQES